MLKLFLQLVARSLRRILNAKRIDKVFASLPAAEPDTVPENADEVCVCALQSEAKLYRGLSAWLTELDGMIGNAAAQGAQLVCLPEFYGMLPVFLSPPLRLALRFIGSGTETDGEAKLDLFPLLSPLSFVTRAYEDIISRFARRYGVYIFGGTYFVAENGRVFNRGFLVSDTGEPAARQDKIFLTVEELGMGLSPGSELHLVPTKLGNIALSVCMDATYFETFRVAKRLGADYIIVPIADTAEVYSDALARRGAPSRVNETHLPAVKPALVSAPGFPLRFTGKAGIYFPYGCGVRSTEAEKAEGSDLLLARFRLSGLRSDPEERTNPAFDEKALHRLRDCCSAVNSDKRKFE